MYKSKKSRTSELESQLQAVHAAARQLEELAMPAQLYSSSIHFRISGWPQWVYRFAEHIKQLCSDTNYHLNTKDVRAAQSGLEQLIIAGFAESRASDKDPDPFSGIAKINQSRWNKRIVKRFTQALSQCRDMRKLTKVLSEADALKSLYALDLDGLYSSLQALLGKISGDLYKEYSVFIRSNGLLDNVVVPASKRVSVNFSAPSGEDTLSADAGEAMQSMRDAVRGFLAGGLKVDDLRKAVEPYLNRKIMLSENAAIRLSITPFGIVPAPDENTLARIKTANGELVGLNRIEHDLAEHIEKFIAGEVLAKHIYLYGAPGTGKTSLVYNFTKAHDELRILLAHPILIDSAISFARDHSANSFWLLYDDWKVSEEDVGYWTGILDGKYVFPKNLEIVITSNQEKVHEKIARRFGQHFRLELPDEQAIMEIVQLMASRYEVDIDGIGDSLTKKFAKTSGAEIERVFKLAKDHRASGKKLLDMAATTKKHKPETKPEMYG